MIQIRAGQQVARADEMHPRIKSIKSILEDKEPTGRSQEKATVDGLRDLEMSTTTQSRKRERRVPQLSLERSETLAPRLSISLLKTALKSPHNKVGMDGSILVETNEKRSWCK